MYSVTSAEAIRSTGQLSNGLAHCATVLEHALEARLIHIKIGASSFAQNFRLSAREVWGADPLFICPVKAIASFCGILACANLETAIETTASCIAPKLAKSGIRLVTERWRQQRG